MVLAFIIKPDIRCKLPVQEVNAYTCFTGIVHLRTWRMNQPAHAGILLCGSGKRQSG